MGGWEGGRYTVIHSVYISLFGIKFLYLCQDLQKCAKLCLIIILYTRGRFVCVCHFIDVDLT